jgi:dihydrofolate reductase
VFSRTIQRDRDENVNFVAGDLVSFFKNLKLQDGKDIWLVGGAAAMRIASFLIKKYGYFPLEL